MAHDQQMPPRREWHLDRKVPITIILALLGVIVTGAGWKTSVEAEGKSLDRRVTALESTRPATEADLRRIGILEANLAAFKEQLDDSRKVLDEIRSLLIQERARDQNPPKR